MINSVIGFEIGIWNVYFCPLAICANSIGRIVAKEQIRKQYYTIGEVAKTLGLTTSLIRFWESEFKELNPRKNRKGNRVYTQKDIDTLERIQYLLKTRGFTIKGAKIEMRNEQAKVNKEVHIRRTLTKLRSFLLELRDSL